MQVLNSMNRCPYFIYNLVTKHPVESALISFTAASVVVFVDPSTISEKVVLGFVSALSLKITAFVFRLWFQKKPKLLGEDKELPVTAAGSDSLAIIPGNTSNSANPVHRSAFKVVEPPNHLQERPVFHRVSSGGEEEAPQSEQFPQVESQDSLGLPQIIYSGSADSLGLAEVFQESPTG